MVDYENYLILSFEVLFQFIHERLIVAFVQVMFESLSDLNLVQFQALLKKGIQFGQFPLCVLLLVEFKSLPDHSMGSFDGVRLAECETRIVVMGHQKIVHQVDPTLHSFQRNPKGD